MVPPKPIHVAIIGSGIGGTTLALALSTNHPHVTYKIYESRSTFSEIGAGIGFSSNGHQAMSLISPALWSRYQTLASFNGTPEKRGVGFNFEIGEKGEDEGRLVLESVLPLGMEQSTCHRKHLLELLVKLLPGEGNDVAEFGKKLVRIEASGERQVCWFADGTGVEADAVVGCDGIKSSCRPFVYGLGNPVSHPVFTGKIAYRGLVPMDKAVQAIGAGRALHRQMYLGHHRHMLTFGVAKGTLMNVVAFHNTGSQTWDQAFVVPQQKDNFKKDFEGWGDVVTKIIELIGETDVWAIFDHPNPGVSTFHNGRICLLGDAAHATSPHHGQGAGMALEDVYILSNLLGACSSTADLEAAFAAYAAVRVPRTKSVTAWSRKYGMIREMEDEEIGDDLEKIAAAVDHASVRWMWDVDLKGYLGEAVERFEAEKAKGIGI